MGNQEPVSGNYIQDAIDRVLDEAWYRENQDVVDMAKQDMPVPTYRPKRDPFEYLTKAVLALVEQQRICNLLSLADFHDYSEPLRNVAQQAIDALVDIRTITRIDFDGTPVTEEALICAEGIAKALGIKTPAKGE